MSADRIHEVHELHKVTDFLIDFEMQLLHLPSQAALHNLFLLR